MIRKLAAAFVALLMLGTGCGADDPAPQQPSQKRSNDPVQVLVFGDPEELEAFRAVVKGFETENGDVNVQLVEASDRSDLIARLATSISGGTPPDVFLLNYRYYGQFAAKNAIAPVDDQLAKSELLDAERLYPQAMSAFQWRGKQLCVPQNISSLVVYYNRDLFATYGVKEPTAGWSWTDFISAASKLTRTATGAPIVGGESEGGAQRVDTYGLGVEPTFIRIAPFVWSNGGQLVDNDRKPTKLMLDSPASKEALRAFLELRLAYGVVPTDQEIEAEDDESRFARGNLAMLLSSRRSTPTFRTIKDFDWDVAPLPVYDQPASILHADGYCITAKSTQQEEAWRFMEFALSPAGQEITARTGRTVPSDMAVSRSPVFLDPNQKPQHSQVFLGAIPAIRPCPTISTWGEIEDVTNGILENALYLGEPVDAVVRKLDAATRPLFARGESP